MADLTVQVPQGFPVGTTLSVYVDRVWDVQPQGPPVSTVVVDANSHAALTGLTPGIPYHVGAVIAGRWRGFLVEVAGIATSDLAGEAVGGVLAGTMPNPGFAVDMATQSELDAAAGARVLRTVHTFAIKGTLSAADSTPSFFVSKAGSESVSIVKARYKVASGGPLTFKVQKNGSDLTGYGTTGSPLSASTTATTTSSTQALAEDDELDLVIVGVSAPVTDLTVTLVLEHTV
jgi:hypothetical protein